MRDLEHTVSRALDGSAQLLYIGHLVGNKLRCALLV